MLRAAAGSVHLVHLKATVDREREREKARRRPCVRACVRACVLARAGMDLGWIDDSDKMI
jgi:hypothetical protein